MFSLKKILFIKTMSLSLLERNYVAKGKGARQMLTGLTKGRLGWGNAENGGQRGEGGLEKC